MKSLITLGAVMTAILVLAGCNGSSGGEPEYTGLWSAQYNLRVDDCYIVVPGVVGFTDRYAIEAAKTGYNFSSTSDMVRGSKLEPREDGSLLVQTGQAGDLFDIGYYCELVSEVNFGEPFGDQADLLFRQTITCEDGYECVSEGVGTARRVLQ